MSVVRRNNRYAARAWNPARKAYEGLGTYPTKAEAQQAVDRHAQPDRMTVERWGRIWLSDYARPAAATRLVYRQAVNTISRELGQLALDAVDRPMARRLAIAWPRNTSAVARTMWADAKRDEVCVGNPWTDMRLKQSRGRKQIAPVTESEVLELAALGDQEMEALILTLAFTGMRPGELQALRWKNVDFEARRIHVLHSRDATGAEKLPKNGKARTVHMPPRAREALQRLPRSLDAEAHVFHSYRGQPLSKANLHYRWRTIRAAWEAKGKPHLDLYELRHAAATMRLERGMSPSDIAIQLGHEDGGALIMSTYGHPDRERSLERDEMAWSVESVEPKRVLKMLREAEGA